MHPETVVLLLNRKKYFDSLKAGHGKGIYLILSIDPCNDEANSKYKAIATKEFSEKFLGEDLLNDRMPDAFQDNDYTLGMILSLGHPIEKSITEQIRLAKSYVSGWFKILDEISNNSVKGLVSVAGGQMYYSVPLGLDMGSVGGRAFHFANKTAKDAVFHSGDFEDLSEHTVLGNAEFIQLLLAGVDKSSASFPIDSILVGGKKLKAYKNMENEDLEIYRFPFVERLFGN